MQQPGLGGSPSGAAGERIQVIIEAAENAAAGIIDNADEQARHYIETSRQRADELADERVRAMADLTDTLMQQGELVKRQSDELLSVLGAARGELAGRFTQELSPEAGPGVSEPAYQEQPWPAQPTHLAPVEPAVPDLQPVEAAPEPEAPPAEPPQEAAPEPPAEETVAQEAAAPEEQSQEPTLQEAPPAAASVPPPFESEQPAAAGGEEASVAPPGAVEAAPPSGGPTPSDGARLLAAQMAVAGSSREEIETRLRNEFGIQDAGPILDGILGPGPG